MHRKFLKGVASVTKTGCWVTNYYKPVNAKGQIKLRYKNKKIFLYQLSHLLFNSNGSDPNSIFHTCNNLICFNPAHLTDNLKEKQFKEKMLGKELLEGCFTNKDKIKVLIDYGNWLFKKLGRSLIQDDFRKKGRIASTTIIKYFKGSMADYFNSCNFPSVRRKQNMADSEMREFLENKKTVTENGCWITDYWKLSCSKERLQIMYKGKRQFLSRVSYTLFKGSIPNGLLALHTCDNPPCFNPEHLIAGTHQDNSRDAAEKGRLVGNTGKNRKSHGITDPYNNKSLLNFVKQHIEITEKDEWIFAATSTQEYPPITINKKQYQLHRLLLANKLGKKYDEIDTACHALADGSKPNKHDVNPDHLFERTPSENMLDTVKYHKGYKLNTDKATQVRDAVTKSDFSEWGSKTSFDKEWAIKLNVSKTCISMIRLGKTWNHDINMSQCMILTKNI